jgi:hypothetical protein
MCANAVATIPQLLRGCSGRCHFRASCVKCHGMRHPREGALLRSAVVVGSHEFTAKELHVRRDISRRGLARCPAPEGTA